MTETRTTKYMEALRHFQYARWQASLEQIFSKLTGSKYELLSYEDTRRLLYAKGTTAKGLRDIPLDAIVGSVGRYNDFTRSFLPLRDSDRDRWARVELEMTGLTGLPPIEVYQIGDVYFVLDGNHRVSVARLLEATTIEAYVTEVQTKVSLTPDMEPDEIILASEYAEFLERTHLDELRPEANLRVTLPGGYREILEYIEIHRYFMSDDDPEEIPFEQAASDWFDEVYSPIAQRIKELGLLRDFPERTPLDLYVWIVRHQTALKESLGWTVPTEAVAKDLSRQFSSRSERVISRVGEKLVDVITPDAFERGPSPGAWRREREQVQSRQRLFENILVPVSGKEEHWYALLQALQVARREGGQILGLFVVSEKTDIDSEEVRRVKAEFYRRSAKAGIPVQFAVDVGTVSRVICERSRWTDLTVIRLIHPPAPNPITRLGSGIRTILHRCAGPLLVVPRKWYSLENPLLAYNGTAKAREALFTTAYLAGRWGLKPTILALGDADLSVTEAMDEAKGYLESQAVDADYIRGEGDVINTILEVAEQRHSDVILLGGYSGTPLKEMVRDSNINELLRTSRLPMLICR